jgi:hypothetical protein
MKRRWTTRLVVGLMLSAGIGCKSAPKFPLTDTVPMMPEGSVAATPKATAPLANATPKSTSTTLPTVTPKATAATSSVKTIDNPGIKSAVSDTSLTMPSFSSVSAPPPKAKSTDLDLKLPDLAPLTQPSNAVQVEATAPAKPLKIDEGMKGDILPAVKSEKIPLIKSEKVSPEEASKFGHAPDYSWVVGVLDRHQRGAYWTVRYAGLGEDDRWGGKIRLMEDKPLPDLRSGDIVRVEGDILAPESAATMVPGGFSYPPYRVKSIRVISKGE